MLFACQITSSALKKESALKEKLYQHVQFLLIVGAMSVSPD